MALYRAGDWAGAVAALTRSGELRAGGDAFDWYFLALAQLRLGRPEEARMWYARAVEWATRNRPTDDELHRFRAEAAVALGLQPPLEVAPPPRPIR